MRKTIKWIGLILVVALLLGVTGFIIWAANPLGPMPEALQAIQSDEFVQVEQSRWLVFEPAAGPGTTGLILYPGGRVDYRSYAPLARLIAIHGYQVVVVPMPLSLAVFAPSRAAQVIEAYPKVENWAIAGHSLGGAMAANFTDSNPDLIDGLILMAAYPASSNNLSGSSVPVASIYGLMDGVAEPEVIRQSQALLPATTLWFPIEGGNHAQFGWYGAQGGDNQATITRETQQDQILEATLELLQQISTSGRQVLLQVLLPATQTVDDRLLFQSARLGFGRP